jgi:glutaredoxin
MKMNQKEVFVEIVAKKKGCILCDLAIGILEEISPEFGEGTLRWEVVDVGDRSGLQRFDDLIKLCGRRPSVPSIVINEKIAFDNIPDFESLSEAVRQAMNPIET